MMGFPIMMGFNKKSKEERNEIKKERKKVSTVKQRQMPHNNYLHYHFCC